MITITLALALASAPTPLRAAPSVVDLGTVRAGVPVPLRFALTYANGEGTLEIVEVRPSCGCLRHSVEARSLRDGGSTHLNVLLHTLTQAPGPNRWRIDVLHRWPGGEGVLTLEVRATIVREVAVEPASLDLPTKRDLTFDVNLTDRRGTPFRVTEAKCSLPFLGVTNAGDNGRWRFTLRFTDAVPVGDHQGTLSIATDDPAYPEIAVPIQVRNRPMAKVSVVPTELVLRLVDGQPITSGVVQLRGEGNIRIETIECDDLAVTVTHGTGSSAIAAVRVRVKATEAGTADVRIRLSEPAGEVIVVPVRWR